MTAFLQSGTDDNAKPIFCVTKPALDEQVKTLSERDRQWLASTGFKAGRGEIRHLPDESGNTAAVVLGLGEHFDMWAWGDLAANLSAGSYRIATELGAEEATSAALAWALGTYRFTRYRECEDTFASLVVPAHADAGLIDRTVNGTFLARDLINTPAQDMGPAELASVAETLAKAHGATFRCVVGDDLLDMNYPAIHAVGRAAARAPRLIDLTWGNADAPKVTLVGKGVCFDTGGLDLKPSAAMLKMKKDMGGSATMMGLASMIMDAGLPVRLRLLIPAAENAVSGDAYRPGDILTTRKGLTVEVGNTDAEGRIVLCDALADADDERPALMLDCATLTGAARVALGPDLPALFTDNRDLAEGLERHGEAQGDPLWRLPLYAPYAEKLKSKVADMNNVSDGPFAGAITAALYLKAFVTQTKAWAHIDTYAWNDTARPGRPAGGEPLGLRSLYAYIAEKFG